MYWTVKKNTYADLNPGCTDTTVCGVEHHLMLGKVRIAVVIEHVTSMRGVMERRRRILGTKNYPSPVSVALAREEAEVSLRSWLIKAGLPC